MELIYGLGISVVTVDDVSRARNAVLALVSCMLDSLTGIEDDDLPPCARKRVPWLRVHRVLLARGLTRLGVVDSVHTKSTIPWRSVNDSYYLATPREVLMQSCFLPYSACADNGCRPRRRSSVRKD